MEKLRPARGGFLRPFGCGWFIREYLLGNGPHDAPKIDPDTGAPQSEIFYHYKTALLHHLATDRATRDEERRSKKEKRPISPEKIEKLTEKYLARLPYKTSSCTYHSFVVYFSNLQRLDWVESTGQEEQSAFQDHYPSGPSKKYFRLTKAGRSAADTAWSNPLLTLYGER